MSKVTTVEVARVSLMPPRKGSPPVALEREARKLLERLQAMGALPTDLEVCEFTHDVLAHDSQLWISLQIRPRVQQVLATGSRPAYTLERIRQAVEGDARTVRSALANLPLNAELAIAKIRAWHDEHRPLASELNDACVNAVHALAGRSIDIEVGDESFCIRIPGFEKTFLDPEVRRISAVVRCIGSSSIEICATIQIDPSDHARASPLPKTVIVTTDLLERSDRLDPLLCLSMRQRRALVFSVQALRCSITGRAVAAALLAATAESFWQRSCA